MRLLRIIPAFVFALAGFVLSGCVAVERVVEARSSADIVTDNEIVLDVNQIMVDLGTFNASTEIYEQRLLVTGLFSDKETYDEFRERVLAVEDVKQIYWHVTYMTEAAQEAAVPPLMDWPDAVTLDANVGVELISTKGVADVNMRVAVDSMRNAYLLGRARSQEELDKALKAVRETEGVKAVVNYVEVRA